MIDGAINDTLVGLSSITTIKGLDNMIRIHSLLPVLLICLLMFPNHSVADTELSVCEDCTMSQLKQTASISFAPPVGNQTGLPVWDARDVAVYDPVRQRVGYYRVTKTTTIENGETINSTRVQTMSTPSSLTYELNHLSQWGVFEKNLVGNVVSFRMYPYPCSSIPNCNWNSSDDYQNSPGSDALMSQALSNSDIHTFVSNSLWLSGFFQKVFTPLYFVVVFDDGTARIYKQALSTMAYQEITDAAIINSILESMGAVANQAGGYSMPTGSGLPGGFGGGLVTITPCPGGNCVDPDEEEENPS